MRNHLADGVVLNINAPKDLLSGELFLLGDLVLISATDADQGELVAARREGVFQLAKASEVVSAGSRAYFDGKKVTTKETRKQGSDDVPNILAGYFLKSAEKDVKFVEVLLSQ